MSPIKDQPARDAAVFSEENVVVTAGAGTGKTTLLVKAVLARVLGKGLDLRKILMLTFTEKAAAEMRRRLEERLRALRRPASKEDKDERADWAGRAGGELDGRIDAALAGLDRAEISTIHSFCAHLLREHPIEAGIDPAFTVDEGEKFDELFDRAWGRWLDVELAADSPRREAWLRVLGRADLGTLRQVAEGLCSFHVPEEELDPDAILKAGTRRLKEVAAGVAKGLRDLGSRHPGPNNLRTQLLETAGYLEDPTEKAGERLPENVSAAKKGWKPEDLDEAKSAMKEALALARDIRRIDEPMMRDAFALLCGFAESFRASFLREGWMTFDGLLTKARDLLASETFPQVRDAAKRRYEFILVDEVQDTDPVQCEILLYLAEGEGRRERDARKVRPAKGRIFIVGDPKQSIYSFRGADIVAYDRLKRQVLAGRDPCRLETNFRSHSGIIGAVNTLFRRIIRRNGELQPDYEGIDAVEGRVPSLPSQKVELVLYEGAGSALSSGDARAAEGEGIARWIAANVGKLRIRGREGDGPMKAGDVAILLRALSDVDVLLECLRARDIPYVVEGEKFYYGTQEVIDFVNLLRAVVNPHDRIALAGLLRSPLGAVDDPELLRIAKAGALDYRLKDPPDSVAKLYGALADLHASHGRMSVPALIDRIFETTDVLELAALSYHGGQAVANLLKMRRSAEAFEASGVSAPNLRAFLRRVNRNIRDLTEEGESPLADETLDAVRILSIHKSKGLEFPVVFVPDLHRTPPGGKEEGVRYDWPDRILGVACGDLIDPGGAALAHLAKLKAREEARRTLYVALTRARERLVLSAGAGFKSGTPMGELAGALIAAGGPDLATADGRVAVEDLAIEVRRETWKEPVAPPKPARWKRKAPAPAWKALDRAWAGRERERDEALAAPRFTSPTRLQESVPERAKVEVDGEARSHAAETGTLCHRVLERMDFRNPDVTRLVREGAAELGVADPSEAEGIVKRFVKSGTFKTLASAEILSRELPFYLPAEGAILQGVIDLVARIDGRVTVIDYKTDREEHPEKYGEQKRWYLEAVRKILGEKNPEFKLLYLRTGRFVG